MAITVMIRYTGGDGVAKAFAEEMTRRGVVQDIRNESGNLGYDYYLSLEDPRTVLLVDRWASQAALDAHHASPMMNTISELRERYDLHMRVERYVDDEQGSPHGDERYIRT